jgi:PHP family Zn ribbon phosphoesterase
MKIIREGKLPETRTYEATCSNCKCVFEFTPPEANLISDPRDGNYFQVACPTCSRLVMRDAK